MRGFTSEFLLRTVVAASLAAGVVAAASASPLRWELSGVSFDDGAVAGGHFVWDAALPYGRQLVDYEVHVSGGAASFPDFTYVPERAIPEAKLQSGSYVGDFDDVLIPVTFVRLASDTTFEGRIRELRLVFSPFLPEEGGTAPIFFLPEKFGTTHPVECFDCGPVRFVVAGAAIAASPEPVDEPQALALLAMSLAAFAVRQAPGRRFPPPMARDALLTYA